MSAWVHPMGSRVFAAMISSMSVIGAAARLDLSPVRAPSHGGGVADSLDEAKAAFRGVWERPLSVPEEAYSALMLAARITLRHFSVSSAMSLSKSVGEPVSAVP